MSTSMEQKIEGKEHFHGSDLEKIEKYFGIPKERSPDSVQRQSTWHLS